MRVGTEKRHIDSYKRIVREANSLIKSKPPIKKEKHEKTLLSRELSAEKKKQELVKSLHELVLHTLSVKVNNAASKKKALKQLKSNTGLIRKVIHKIKDINNYIEESLLKDLGIIKKPLIIRALKTKNPEKFLKSRRGLPKEYLKGLEQAVYSLMQEIIFFDEKLIRGYSKKGIKAAEKEKADIKDIESVLERQAELLDALEAKMPPAGKIKEKLFSRANFNSWAPYVFALLAGFEAEHSKEKLIFSKFKKNNKARKKIEAKIKHITQEKEKVFRIKQERVLSMDKIEKIDEDYRQAFHEYVNAASL